MRFWSPIVELVSDERNFPQAEPAPWGGEHPGLVGQGHELLAGRVVQLAGQGVGADADGGEQVGPADVTDEQGVAGEHAVRRRAGVLVHHDRDRLGRARSLQDSTGSRCPDRSSASYRSRSLERSRSSDCSLTRVTASLVLRYTSMCPREALMRT